jgi:hypothetical protein
VKTFIAIGAVFPLLFGAVDASANTADRKTVKFDNGETLSAEGWIQSESDWDSCGDFRTKAEVSATPGWLKNVTSFNPEGISAGVSLVGVTGTVSGSSGSPSAIALNDKGQKGAFVSGKACMSGMAFYLGMTVTGSALHYGNIRSVSTSL